MAGRLSGKRAVITAAGQGMGRATALAFAGEGAEVIATDIDEAAVRAAEDTPPDFIGYSTVNRVARDALGVIYATFVTTEDPLADKQIKSLLAGFARCRETAENAMKADGLSDY